jgi:uncharacterized membrane protein
MTRKKAMTQTIGAMGLMLQAAGYFMRARTPGLILEFVGLGVFFLSLKVLYEISEPRTPTYELFPKNAKPRTP